MKKRKRKQLGSVRGDLYFPFEAHRPFTGGPHLGLTSRSLFALGWAGSCSLATENQQAPAQPPGLPGALASAVPKQGKVPGAGGLLWWGEVKGTVMERRGREAMYEGRQNCSTSLRPRPVRGAEVPSSLGSATEFWTITQEKMNSLPLKTTVCSELFVTAAYPIP